MNDLPSRLAREQGSTIDVCPAHGIENCIARGCFVGDRPLYIEENDEMARQPREKLGIRTHADSRPRVYMRLREGRGGSPEIAVSAGTNAIERSAPTMELALAAVVDDVAQPAVIMWAGVGER